MTALPAANRHVGPLVALVLAFAAVLGIGLLAEPAAAPSPDGGPGERLSGALDRSRVRTDGAGGRMLTGQVVGYDANGEQLCVDIPDRFRIADRSDWFRLPEAETATYCIRPPADATGTLVIPLEEK